MLISSEPAIGLGWRLDAGTELGLSASATALDDEHFNTSRISLQPTIKHYFTTADRWTPYALLGVGWSWHDTEYETISVGEERGRGLNVDVGFGLEWFALERASLGAHAGVSGSWEDVEETREIQIGPSEFQIQRTEYSRRYVSLFNSGVRATLYF